PPPQPEFKERILADLPDSSERDGWLAALNDYEKESLTRGARREKLFGSRKHNSRWKLDAVDFFNEELMRFLSFNNAILASIEDVIIVCDPQGRVVYQNPAAKRLAGYRENPGPVSQYLGSVLDGRGFEVKPGVLHFVPTRDG